MSLQINAHRGLKMRYKELEKTRRWLRLNRLKELREEKRLSQKEMAIAEKTRRLYDGKNEI